MSSDIASQTEAFFDRLEEALGRSTPQNRSVLAELRSDLAAEIEAMQAAGSSEEEAARMALENLGSPELLAAEMKLVLPPFSSGWVRGVRYVLSVGLIAWTLLLVWMFRAWEYGWSYGPALAMALHLPVILILWPDFVWRKNWLFGLIPAGIAVAVAIFLSSVGLESSQELSLAVNGEAEAVVEKVDDGIRWQLGLLFGALSVLLIVLFGALQRVRQRRMAFLAVALPLLLVEGLFQWEEARFRAQRDQLSLLLKESAGSLPERGTMAEAGVDGGAGTQSIYQLSEDGTEFTMWWTRPLGPAFSICYSSQDGRIWMND